MVDSGQLGVAWWAEVMVHWGTSVRGTVRSLSDSCHMVAGLSQSWCWGLPPRLPTVATELAPQWLSTYGAFLSGVFSEMGEVASILSPLPAH